MRLHYSTASVIQSRRIFGLSNVISSVASLGSEDETSVRTKNSLTTDNSLPSLPMWNTFICECVCACVHVWMHARTESPVPSQCRQYTS